MKNFTLLLICLFISTSNLIFAQQGTLDYHFGDSGKVTIKKSSYCQSLAIQADGKIVLGGYSGLVRLKMNGELDSDFASRGIAKSSFNGKSVAIQPDGKIILGGFTSNNGIYDFALSRYKANGRLDSAFGNNGLTITDFGGTVETGNSVAIQTDGKIILAGGTNSMDPYGDLCMARYRPNGKIDTSFGTNGKVIKNMSGHDDEVFSVAVQADRKIVAAGTTLDDQAHGDFILVRYKPNGKADSSFGTNGIIETDFGGDDRGNSVAIQTDGKIVVAGSSDLNFALIRYNPNGKTDSSFGINGKVITDFGSNDFGYTVAIQADGKIVAGGSTGNYPNIDFALVRYKPNGKTDSSFGTNGKVITDFGSIDFGYDAAIQADGKIVVAGNSNGRFAVARYNAKNPSTEINQNNNFANIQALDGSNANMYLFPNPVSDVLNVGGLKPSVVKTISIIDNTGKILLKEITLKNTYTLNLKQITPGIYFVKIYDGNKTSTLKFIKQ